MQHKTPPSIVELRRILLEGPCADIPVGTTYPASTTLPYVRIQRIGGRPENAVTDAPRFIIHVYADDGIVAEALALDILDWLDAGVWRSTRAASGHYRRGWRHETVMPLSDPDRPSLHRWQIHGALRLSRLTPA